MQENNPFSPGLHKYEVFYENADTDELRRSLGFVNADTMAEALHRASQYYEVPSYDLVAVQVRHANGKW